MGKSAIMFPGQGAQSVGMGQELYDASSTVRALYDKASQILGYDLSSVCFNGPEETLVTTEQSQPAIFLTGMAAIEYLRETEPETIDSFQAAAGLSLGEYSALVFAGAISFEDGLRLVRVRGQAMQKAADQTAGGMVSILGLETSAVEVLCQSVLEAGLGPISVANYLCPGNYAVSGTKEACDLVAKLAQTAGAIKVVPLAVAGAFHTELMAPAVDTLRDALEQVEISVPRIPVISNVDTASHTDPADIRNILLRQLRSAVRWEDSMRKLIDEGFDTFYEVAPGRVLRGLMKRINRKVNMNK